MNILQAIILGIVQGITEFLPISSKTHLLIVPFVLGWKFPAEQVLPFNVLVQLGSLTAVIVYFRADIWHIIQAFVKGILSGKPFAETESRLGWLIILATIPAGLFGILAKKLIEQAFQSMLLAGLFLVVTAFLLLAAEWIGKRNRDITKITWVDALWIGVAQAIAVFPGISRSGSTMAGAMARNLDRTAAARFSFLMSIPIMLAAGLLEIKDVITTPGLSSLVPEIVAGFIAAAVVGYLSIRWMLNFVTTHTLRAFAVYCAAVGVLVVIIYVAFPK